MPTFMVRRYDAGIPDEKGYQKVEAESELEAAEKVCGCKLVEGAVAGTLCAMAVSFDDINKGAPKKAFRRA